MILTEAQMGEIRTIIEAVDINGWHIAAVKLNDLLSHVEALEQQRDRAVELLRKLRHRVPVNSNIEIRIDAFLAEVDKGGK